MNRRQLAFVIILNALVSLVIALTVVWVVELRRPDPEELAAVATPLAAPTIVAAPTPTPAQVAASNTTPAAAEPVPTAAAASAEETVYEVAVGDSLSGIADKFGITVAAIVEANKLENPDFVFTGQRLVIPNVAARAAAAATPANSAGSAAANTGIRVAAIASPGVLTGEALSVVNDSDLAINLQGWRLEKEGGPAYVFGDVPLFPGSGIQLFSGVGADTSVALYWNQAAPVWPPGSTARLINPQGAEVSRVAAQ